MTTNPMTFIVFIGAVILTVSGSALFAYVMARRLKEHDRDLKQMENIMQQQAAEDEAFEKRKEANAKIERKNNSALYAGSPMYYYCRTCGAEMVLPETHWCVAPRYCVDCQVEGRAR